MSRHQQAFDAAKTRLAEIEHLLTQTPVESVLYIWWHNTDALRRATERDVAVLHEFNQRCHFSLASVDAPGPYIASLLDEYAPLSTDPDCIACGAPGGRHLPPAEDQ